MAKLSDKYIAGFIDSDGSIEVFFRKATRGETDPDIRRIYVGISFTQLTRRDEVLYRIQEAIGGQIYIDDQKLATTLKVFSRDAEMALNRMLKHLVIKRHYAAVALSLSGKVVSRKETSVMLKQERRRLSLPFPNFPSRKWLAGYFDGDGCIGVRLPKGRSSAQITAEITSTDYDAEGIEIIRKVFGGSVNAESTERKHLRSWTMTMPPSKAIEFLGYFAQHLIIKKDQANFILGCAAMGHYRDGKSIKAAMKQLKAQSHRLNEPSPVNELLKSVEDIPSSGITMARKNRMDYARSLKGQAIVGQC